MKGLYGKYIILKADTNKKIDGDAFVLRPDRDPAAIAALRAYARATNNKALADDIIAWIGENHEVASEAQSYREADGCPTETDVLRREWRKQNADLESVLSELYDLTMETENPKPLTLDELMNMDAELVYVPETDHYYSAWGRVNAAEKRVLANGGGYYPFESYSEWWIAYRYPTKPMLSKKPTGTAENG